MNTHKIQWDRYLLSLIFLTVLCLPAIDHFVHISPRISIDENRNLNKKPELKFDRSILSYPSKFQMYFNDHFGFREVLIRLEKLFKNKLLNVSIIKEKSTLGKDGWLFLDKEEDIKSDTPLSGDELINIKDMIETRKSFFKEKGINYFIVVAPDAESIYPEYLPQALQSRNNTNRYDQLYAYLRSNSKQDIFIDVKQVLLKNKEFILPAHWKNELSLTANTANVYYKTDIHWTYLGAYLAYNEILLHLKTYYPWIDLVPITAFELTPARTDHLRRIHQWLPVQESNYDQRYILTLPDNFYLSKWPQIKTSPGFHQLNLLIVGDSMVYFFMLDWFKPPLFKITYIYKKTAKDIILKEIAKDKPDIFIDEVRERGMNGLFYRLK